MTQHDPFPGLPDPAPAAVVATVDACEHFIAHLDILAGQLRELRLGTGDTEQIDTAAARVGVRLATLTAITGEQRP
ncbi:hypothetical protein OG339_48820 (plasmid) [Streptosporangium sp. NBC_01495]|uniref:hypothetical protein n=1 Tax=Streptosporangium sp. NBC_01495 TaxID=2903899 RepID=UPI002E2FA3F3|nr:hypothetical protein [Streptosporangium sp. NBC_01495]